MTVDRDAVLTQAGRHSVRAERRRVSPAASSASGATASSSGRRYEEFACRIEFWGDEVEQLSIINPTSGEVIRQEQELFIYPAKHFVMPEERIAAAIDAIKQELEERLEELKNAGQAARSPAAERPHAVRHRDDAGSGLLPGHRELQPAAVRPSAGLDAAHAVQLLSGRLPAVRRRIARHGAAGARHVRRRPQPQDDAGRARLSACPARSTTAR